MSIPARIPFRFSFLVLLVLLAGCISHFGSATNPEMSSASLKPDQGIVFLSFLEEKVTRMSYSSIFLRFRDKAQGGVGHITILPGMLYGIASIKMDGDNRGDIISHTLPAGDYEFYNFAANFGHTEWSAKEDFSIPFTVVSGRASYLGEIRIVPMVSRDILGFKNPAGGVFVVSSNAGRDVPLFRKKFPKIDPAIIVQRPLRPGPVSSPLVVFR